MIWSSGSCLAIDRAHTLQRMINHTPLRCLLQTVLVCAFYGLKCYCRKHVQICYNLTGPELGRIPLIDGQLAPLDKKDSACFKMNHRCQTKGAMRKWTLRTLVLPGLSLLCCFLFVRFSNKPMYTWFSFLPTETQSLSQEAQREGRGHSAWDASPHTADNLDVTVCLCL